MVAVAVAAQLRQQDADSRAARADLPGNGQKGVRAVAQTVHHDKSGAVRRPNLQHIDVEVVAGNPMLSECLRPRHV